MTTRSLAQERKRKWFIVILWTLLIYSIIPIGRPVSNFLEQETPIEFLLNLFYLVLVFSFCVLFFWKGNLRKRRSFILLGSALLAYSFLIFISRFPVEKIHLIEYCFLSVFIYRALSLDIKNFWVWILSLLICGTVGWGDEIIQYFVPNRVYDPVDILINVAGGLFGLIFTAIVLYERRQQGTLPNP